MTRPILRRIRLVPLESFDVLEELRQESHKSVYAYRIHHFKADVGECLPINTCRRIGSSKLCVSNSQFCADSRVGATLRGARCLTYAVSRMKNLLLALLHLAVMTAKLCGPGGVRAVIAENLVLKQQLIVLRRARRRAPNLTLSDRLLCGFGSLFLSPGRIRRLAIAVRLSMANCQSCRKDCRSPESDRRPRLILWLIAGQDNSCWLRSSSRFDLSR